jgi:hypothetical protein
MRLKIIKFNANQYNIHRHVQCVRKGIVCLLFCNSVRSINEIRVEFNSALPVLVKPNIPAFLFTSHVRSAFPFLLQFRVRLSGVTDLTANLILFIVLYHGFSVCTFGGIIPVV